LVFIRNATTEAYFTAATEPGNPIRFNIGENGSSFNYRTYNREPTFCNILPNSNLAIVEDYPAANGAPLTIVTTIIDSDNDGIPNEDEDDNIDGDFNYLTNPLNTDGDTLPNYMDADDDNDNVLTIDEDDNIDGDNNPFTDPRRTDGDDKPDYLDADDDGDGVLTRLEDEGGNQNPTDDFLMDMPGETPRFLNPEAANEFPDPGFRDTNFKRTFTTRFTIQNLGIEIINAQFLDFGTYVRIQNFTVDN
jgi:hypothetical protein